MAIGISVTGDAVLGYVITVTDADAQDLVHVYRVDQSGHYETAIVRELDMASPTGSTMVVTDHEAPWNTTLRYFAESYDAGDTETPVATAQSSLVTTTIPTGFVLISDPLDANQRVALAIEELNEWEYSGRELGTHHVLGRRHPVLNMGVEEGRSGSIVGTNLNIYSIDYDENGPYPLYEVKDHANFETIFRPGRTLLLRNTWSESGFDDLYFKATSHKTERLVKVGNNNGNVFKRFTITYKEQDRPTTRLSGLALGTWQTIFDSNATWSEVNTDHGSWTSALVDSHL